MREPFVHDPDFTLWQGDALEVLREERIEYDAIVTSPPYLDARPEYGSPDAQWWDAFFAIAHGPALINVGRLWRDGCESDWWMRLLGYAKANGWRHLDTLAWVKPNANPIHGQVFANSHEYVLILARGNEPLNTDAIRRPYEESALTRMRGRYLSHNNVKGVGANGSREPHAFGARARSYISIAVAAGTGNDHPAPMAEDLATHLVLLATWPGGTVLDPFMGSGTTALVARKHGRKAVGIELNESYCELAATRLQQLSLLT